MEKYILPIFSSIRVPAGCFLRLLHNAFSLLLLAGIGLTAAGFAFSGSCPRLLEASFLAFDLTDAYLVRVLIAGSFFLLSEVQESRIVFTCIRRGIIDGSARSRVDEKLVFVARRMGMPWVFGLDPERVDRYLAGWRLPVVEHAGAPDYRERYLKPLGRRMNIFEGERVVLTRVEGSNPAGPGSSQTNGK
ncbi:hypothetical protein FTO70_06810 [Methanosarcina sp. KYL-1]|uniref:hypothetical protein n=1 Tax=Methanosarcina sp. KYL-1 TaxID=2602068 RepID=UPI0021012ABF|nr:hypothetical protein [Methanosarcina sp. KYL-1]MCQ1535402.1 hypothetical protein [Methanosarcina sp. KYL-1]